MRQSDRSAPNDARPEHAARRTLRCRSTHGLCHLLIGALVATGPACSDDDGGEPSGTITDSHPATDDEAEEVMLTAEEAQQEQDLQQAFANVEEIPDEVVAEGEAETAAMATRRARR